jgi:choline transport protein
MEFIIGLTSPVIAFCPMDGAVHLVDQVKQAPYIIPKTIMAALVISFVTSIAFTLAMLYCVSDFDAVLSTPSGFPLFEIWSQATSTNVIGKRSSHVSDPATSPENNSLY